MDLAQKPVYKLDLAAGTSVVNLTTPLVEGDDRAQTFILELTDKGSPANLNGYSVTAYFGRGKTAEAESDTIAVPGSVSGNVATITLTESCYSRSCYFSMPIRLTNGTTGQKRTYLIVRGTVVKSVDGTIIDPDGSVPTLDDLFAQIAVMERSRQAAEEATEEALAAAARADEARAGIQDNLATLTQEIDRNTAPPIIPTATGEIVTISDSANRPLAGLRLYGKTTQDGTPTPNSHVPLVNVGAGGSIGVKASGKNLIDMRGAAGGTSSGVTVTVNADGSYVMNGTATDINVNVWFSGDYHVNAPTLFVLPAGTYYVAGIALFSGTTFVSNNYQINGSFFTIAEDTPITGVRCTYVTSGQTYSNTVVYPIVAAGNEVASFEPYKDGGSLTASTPNGLPGIPVSSGGNYTDADGKIWLSTVRDYGRGVDVENIKTVVLTGAEQVVTFDGWHAGSYRIESGYGNAYTVSPEQTNERVLCTHATAKNVHNVAVNGYIGVSVAKEGLTLCLSHDHARADDLKAYLSAQYAAGNPVKVAYALAEPIETPIPADELAAYRAMTSQYPNTTVYNGAGAGMAVDYIADTKNYIDKKIAAIAAATL